MENLKMHTPDLADENFKKLAALFPNAVTETITGYKANGEPIIERAIDADVLRQEISATVVDGPQERYQFTWPDKKKSVVLANQPIAKTLRLDREKSVGKDGTPGNIDTENIYIEGDNLDALKLLQETYLGKVKMIYIDPPYNTGNDFIYEDDFSQNADEYLGNSGQFDKEGNRLVQNTESNGRFHTDWLNMIYPRLRLAKDLLTGDGVIFISIDGHEYAALYQLCCEIFNQNNYLGTIIWKNVTDNNPSQIAEEHEYILCFAKNTTYVKSVWKSSISLYKDILITIGEKFNSQYEDKEKMQAAYTKWFRDNKAQLGPLDRYKYIDAGGVYTGSQSVHNPGRGGYHYDVIHPVTHKPCKEPLMGYRFPEETMSKMLEEGKILFGKDENKIIELKVYAKDFLDKLSSVFELDGRIGAYDLKTLFGEKPIFSNPKPVEILSRLISFIVSESDTILDFFSGSASIAEAVMVHNSLQKQKIKYICVQFPEDLDVAIKTATKKSKETMTNAIKLLEKLGKPHNICEIGEERIRRAGKKIKEESPLTTTDLDIGFRVFKVDSTNMEDVYYRPADYNQGQMELFADNIKSDRTPEDLLFQVMLDLGILLSSDIQETEIAGKKVFSVADGYLIACFDKNVTEETVKAIAQKQPVYAVFRDNSMASDSVATNFEQIFETYSPRTQRKVL
ncbi:putative methyltransferase [uncultured Blautia sp.]|nr:site-specific DNA-methyltransferase [uncultured Blautia sp.]SCH66386.1 putative methyltransferase [uncultured Blautia sp.]